jgi:hypothetical protein
MGTNGNKTFKTSARRGEENWHGQESDAGTHLATGGRKKKKKKKKGKISVAGVLCQL